MQLNEFMDGLFRLPEVMESGKTRTEIADELAAKVRMNGVSVVLSGGSPLRFPQETYPKNIHYFGQAVFSYLGVKVKAEGCPIDVKNSRWSYIDYSFVNN